ncbi:ribosomal protein S18-alanine N-acetyltransferase [Pleurocapsa sp. PCC 7319]|uniref:ribosomal protein S18-alanine N-acetyltransferase n=1 Tax=Pleurocapsa sp. PCC 7319 TaxID=118161 RepID=UPI00034CF8B9|nr:ribosomal protein S18-alanine N-acetyltransferase [Pleurocapsa sp. PCC 7319]
MKILEIEPLIASQVREVVALDQVCLDGLWTAEGYLRELDSPNSSLLTLSLADTASESFSAKIIGFACLWSIVEEAHITLLAIHPDYRRQGLGQLLLLTLLRDAIARKLEWVTLEVNNNNSNAISLYKKFGFQVIGTRKGYYQKTEEDALILWLKDIQKPDFQLNLSRWQQNTDKNLRSQYYYLK